ncbi:hypothetical protein [Marinagarivorans algicola]|uniref:hypothetical protein n=1 Tax=Marinagarivorans algicola TaxID=1513270 RepID=UPI0006B57B77|nr:hypothetical protein [Marinagarivorans algicola]
MNKKWLLIFCMMMSNFVAADKMPSSIAHIYVTDTFYKNTNKISLLSDGRYINTNTDIFKNYQIEITDEVYRLILNEREFFEFSYARARSGEGWATKSKDYRVVSRKSSNGLYTISATDSVQSSCIDGVTLDHHFFTFDVNIGLISSVSLVGNCKTSEVAGALTYSFDWAQSGKP